MRVLITGSCGFVGRRFATRLADRGDDVTAVDNLVVGLHPVHWAFPPRSWNNLHFVEQDCREFFRHHDADEWDLIIHCAAIVGGRLKIDGDPLAVATDLSIDAEMYNWIVRAKNKPKLIYFSSSAIYPVELQTKKCHCQLAEALVNFNSTRISFPDMTYGFVKLAGEYLAKFAYESYGLHTVIYRPFGGYGEDQDFNYPFPSIVKRVLNKEDPVVVWGSGNQLRDFIYIEDVVSAVLETYERLGPTEVLNLGTGYGLSFLDLAQIACDVLHHDGVLANDPTRPEGVFARVADTAKLNTVFVPSVSVRDGVQKVADFMRKQGIAGSPKLRLLDEACSTQTIAS